MSEDKARSPQGTPHRRRIAHIVGLGALLLFSLVPILASAEQPAPLPPEVRAYFDDARRECRKAGDLLHVQDETSYAEKAEFNGDGRPDYIVHMAALVCPALGLSEYCGSAGCSVSILVSEGNHLREAAGINLQAFTVTPLVNGRQSIAFAAHGTYCGHKTGTDTCFGTMSWARKGFKTTYSNSEPAALKQMDTAQAAPAGIDPVKDSKYDWHVVGPAKGKPGATIAMSDGSASQPRVVVACAEKTPVLVLAFPPGPKAPPIGVRVMVDLGDPAPGQPHANVVLQPVKDKGAYIGRLTPPALAILRAAGKQSYPFVSAAWLVEGRDYWIDIPSLPLAHFDEVSRPVLATCT